MLELRNHQIRFCFHRNGVFGVENQDLPVFLYRSGPVYFALNGEGRLAHNARHTHRIGRTGRAGAAGENRFVSASCLDAPYPMECILSRGAWAEHSQLEKSAL